MSIDGQLLKRLRKAKGKAFTQEYMAKMFEVSLGAWRNWEQCLNTPDTPMLTKIADYFGISVDVLLGRKLNDASTKKTQNKECDKIYNMLCELSKENLTQVLGYVQALYDSEASNKEGFNDPGNVKEAG